MVVFSIMNSVSGAIQAEFNKTRKKNWEEKSLVLITMLVQYSIPRRVAQDRPQARGRCSENYARGFVVGAELS
jgi:hypothetical protein